MAKKTINDRLNNNDTEKEISLFFQSKKGEGEKETVELKKQTYYIKKDNIQRLKGISFFTGDKINEIINKGILKIYNELDEDTKEFIKKKFGI